MPPLEQNEKILYTARKHWFILAGETIFIAMLAVLPGLLLFTPYVFPSEFVNTIREFFAFEGSFLLVTFFLWSLLLLCLWIAFFMFWTDYYLDVWFVTNLRVIAMEQRGLFDRSISTFRHDMIQDATVEVPGLLATLLKFGTVEVSTASDYSFIFKGAARPHALKDCIMAEHHRVQRERQGVYVKSA